MILAEKPIAELAAAQTPPAPPKGFRGWSLKLNEKWVVRRWLIGGLSSTVWSGAGAAFAGAMTIWPAQANAHFVGVLSSSALALFGAVTSSAAGSANVSSREGERQFAARTRVRLAAQSIQNWLDHHQAALGSADYRLTLLLCVKSEHGYVLKPVFRDRNHPISSPATPTVCADQRARCQGVAGHVWFERALAEVATKFSFKDDPSGYCAEMEIDPAFAQRCRRHSRYYLGIPLMHAGHPMGVLTVDSAEFGCLVKLRTRMSDLQKGQKQKHAEKRFELEKASDYLAVILQEFFEASGVNLGNHSA